MDIGLGPDQPQSIATANRIEQQDAVDKLHASPREPQRGRQVDAVKKRSKTPGKLACSEGGYSLVIIAFRINRNKILPAGSFFAGQGSRVLLG